MRKLKAHDLFAAARVIAEIGVKDEVKEICRKADDVTDVWAKGYDLVYTIFEKAVKERSEDLIFEFFAGVFEKPAEELKNGDALEFIEELTAPEAMEVWKAFFTKLAGLITSVH